MNYSVDRIEGNYVILIDSDGAVLEVERSAFSFDVREGEIVQLREESFISCRNEAEVQRSKVRSLMSRFKNRG